MSTRDILDLDGKVALVTGGGQGAGRAIALMLAEHGAAVAVNDYVIERAEAVAGEIAAAGGKALAVQADVSDLGSVRAMSAKAADGLGAVTILVNNAGMAGPTAQMRPRSVFWEEDPGEWGKYLGTNLYGVFNCCHALVPGMVAAGHGRIVTIVSDAGRVGEPRQAVYSAAKAGAAGFVRSLARETGRHGVTCNAISLSSVNTMMSDEQLETFMAGEQAKAQFSRYIIRRMGRPDEVAALTLFLCSDAASWISGQTYPLNGGYSVAV
ncbi:MAG: SDR family oxidoreductase [Novosphingobium sp.]|nr:SDR family oxidoreductase [Novosphingobium sp.]